MKNKSTYKIISNYFKQRWLVIAAAFCLAMILGLSISPDAAYAQSVSDLPTYEGIQDAAELDGDTSRAILTDLLGDFGDNPWAQAGAATTLLGNLFFIFNGALFVVAGVYLGYGMLVAVAQTANSGEVLGKNIDGFWVTIRMTLGIFGMVPAFSGFSLAQAFMYSVTILGIGIANMLNTAAIDLLADYTPILPSSSMTAATGSGAIGPEVINNLLLMNVCAATTNANENLIMRLFGDDGTNSVMVQPVSEGDNAIRITSKGPKSGFFNWFSREGACGTVDLSYKFRTESGLFSAFSGYSLNSVNYDNINKAGQELMKQRAALLKKTNNDIAKLVQKWATDSDGKFDTNFPDQEFKNILIDTQEKDNSIHNEQRNEIVGTDKSSALTEHIKENMKKGGWLSLGSWGATYAEVGAAMQSALSTELSLEPPPTYISFLHNDENDKNDVNSIAYNNVTRAMGSVYNEINANTCSIGIGKLSVDIAEKNATNHCAPGQSAIMWVIDTIVNDTGGSNRVNPITASKQLGDFMLTTVSTVIGLSVADSMISGITGGSGPVSWAVSAVKNVASFANPISAISSWMKSLFGGLAEPFGSIANALLLFFIVGGIVFSIYIPFVPFITWTTAVLSYFASVLEGLIAAQVWAFSHLSMGQEQGMGQRANQGYYFLMNMLLRPALMVIGFFMAMAISTLVATFIFAQFGTALANVQGDSWTGLFSMVGILMVVMLLLLTLIQTSYNLIYELSDRTLSWFGHQMNASIAKEMDGKVEAGIQRGATTAGGAVMGSKALGRMGGQASNNSGKSDKS